MATNNSINNASQSLDLPLTTTTAPIGQITFNATRWISQLGTHNTFVGENSGNLTLTTGSATDNTGIGQGCLVALTTGANNFAGGSVALAELTTGSGCVAVGEGALNHITTGSNCIGIGLTAGTSYTTSDSSNICIGNSGTAAHSNEIVIGTQGSGAGQQNTCFIAGVVGVTVSNPNFVQINTSTGQLGAATSAALFTSVTRQVFTSTGTYTPTAGMLFCDIEVLGGGGGGGGVGASALTNSFSVGGGGGAGGYARKIFTAATIGASKAVTIGAAGAAGSAGGASGGAGGAGGTTSVGATLISATGGAGGALGVVQTATPVGVSGGAGGVGSLGDFNANGACGGMGLGCAVTSVLTFSVSGVGASSLYGGGGLAVSASNGSGVGGNAATLYGSGGSGGSMNSQNAGQTGGAGSAGLVIITEYI